jgi:TP901 family phage tail tape measure protein
MPELRVRIGASLDPAFDQIFRKLPATAAAANKVLLSQQKAKEAQDLAVFKAGLAQKTAAEKTALAVQAQLLRNKVNESNKIRAAEIRESQKVHDHIRSMEIKRLDAKLKAESTTAARSVKIATDAARQKARAELTETERVTREMTRIGENYERRRIASLARARMGINEGMPWRQNGRDMPYRMGYWASRNLSPVTPMLSVAGRLGRDILRGAGIDLNLGSMVGTYVRNQKLAQDIANAGWQPSLGGPNARHRAAAEVMTGVKEAADFSAMERGGALGGLRAFVGKTGDLETGLRIMKDMGVVARATGSSFEDMVDAAGDVSNSLGNMPEKGAVVSRVMRVIAGQGKQSAVEIRDLAVQMAKLAAAAPQFEGAIEANIGIMGGLAQEARMRGGAASATQAATSVMSFMNTFSKGARIKNFKAAGIDVFGASGKIRSPEELILESLAKTGGNTEKMGKLFMDIRARTVTRGFETIYKEAGGGQKGLEAVHGEFERLRKAAMTDKEVNESFQDSMKGSEAQIQLFKNRLEDLGTEVAMKTLPALDKLRPMILTVVEKFASAIEWIGENPFSVIPVAIGAAIAKAGIEQTLRVGIENVFRTVIGGTAGVGPAGRGVAGGAGIGGNLAAGLTIAAMAVTTFMVGKMIVDQMLHEKEQKDKSERESEWKAIDLTKKLENKGTLTQEDINAAKARVSEIDKEIKRRSKPGFVERELRGLALIGDKLGLVDATAIRNEDKRTEDRAHDLRQQQIRLLDQINRGIADMIHSAANPTEFVGPPTPSPEP